MYSEKQFYFVKFVYIFVFSVHGCRDELPRRSLYQQNKKKKHKCKISARFGAGQRRPEATMGITPGFSLQENCTAGGIERGLEGV